MSPRDLLDVCRRTVDPHAVPLETHQNADGAPILRAATCYGLVIVKPHRTRQHHKQELHAYRAWAPLLGERAPRLVAATDDPPAIIVTVLPGRPLVDFRGDVAAERDAYRQAGELLHQIHGLDVPRIDIAVTAWLAERGRRWLDLADDLIPADQRAVIRAHLDALAEMGALPAVPCHLDFTPRNLIRSVGGNVGVVDFEHARVDLPARDLVRLATRVWNRRSDLRDAFHHGYGPLTDVDEQVIEHCFFLDRLTRAVRAAGRRVG
jgi:Ser/Thr protein kinase RdoA (MazF antagonist)